MAYDWLYDGERIIEDSAMECRPMNADMWMNQQYMRLEDYASEPIFDAEFQSYDPPFLTGKGPGHEIHPIEYPYRKLPKLSLEDDSGTSSILARPIPSIKSADTSMNSKGQAAEEARNTGKDVIIAVMGVTGAGKSSLIAQITGRKDIGIGKGLRSQTQKVTPFKFKHKGVNYILVDTPGFNDTARTDAEILEEIVTWLSSKHGTIVLSGIIYLQPISDTRVQGSTMTQLQVFKKLCGKDFYKHVVLGTTFWGTTAQADAERREKELFSTMSFLGDMKAGGSKTVRITADRNAVLGLIEVIARGCGKESTMRVQKELERSGGLWRNTQAAMTLSSELAKLNKKFEKQMKNARHVSVTQKIKGRIQRVKHEREAKKLNEKNQKIEEERLRVEEAERVRVQAEADRAARERAEKERILQEKAEQERIAHDAAMAVLEAQRVERERQAELLRREQERERERARVAAENRKREIEMLLAEQERQRREELAEEKRITRVSRDALCTSEGGFVCGILILTVWRRC